MSDELLLCADEILRKWAHALAARSFYPSSHPTVRAAESDLLTALTRAHELGGPLAVAVVDERLLHGNDALPSASSSGRPIHKALRNSYVDRVTFEPGVSVEELSTFLDAMVSSARGQGVLGETAHVRLEFIVKAEEREGLLEKSSLLVKEIHTALAQGGPIDYAHLAEVVGGLLAIVSSDPHTILPLARIKEHDEYTFVHTVNVSILSAATAHYLGCARGVVHDVLVAGILHDVGKQHIPREILHKPGRLTQEEAEIVRRHPEDGARTLMSLPGIPDMAVVVAYEHHQRADGAGYPHRAAGWEPHLASRIVQVADVFDALRTHRPYQAAMSVRKILDVFRQEEKSFTDPELARLFLAEVALRGHDAVASAAKGAADDEAAAVVERL
ncbi:MAG: HD domain-containing protein [bacterium]